MIASEHAAEQARGTPAPETSTGNFTIWQLHGEPLIFVNLSGPSSSLTRSRQAPIVVRGVVTDVEVGDVWDKGTRGEIVRDRFTVTSSVDGERHQFDLTRSSAYNGVSTETLRALLTKDEYVFLLRPGKPGETTAESACWSIDGTCVLRATTKGAQMPLFSNQVLAGSESVTDLGGLVRALGGERG